MVLLDYIPKTHVIGGLPFLDSDVPDNAGSLESRGFWGLRRRYKSAIDQAMLAPDTWIACPAPRYIRFRWLLRVLGFRMKPDSPQKWVILDPTTRRFVFVEDDRLEAARQGKFHSKFGAVRPNAVC